MGTRPQINPARAADHGSYYDIERLYLFIAASVPSNTHVLAAAAAVRITSAKESSSPRPIGLRTYSAAVIGVGGRPMPTRIRAKLRRTQHRDDRLHAAVAAGAACGTHTQLPRRQIQIVVDDEQIGRFAPIVAKNRLHRFAAQIHIRHRLDEQHIVAVEFRLGNEAVHPPAPMFDT